MEFTTEHYSIKLVKKLKFSQKRIKVNYLLLENVNEWNVENLN